MYRVFLFIAFLAYCSSVPFINSNIRQPIINEQADDTDVVDDAGGGYSYFRKQKIDLRPLTKSPIDIPSHDLSAYLQANAFKQQPIQNEIFTANNQLFSNRFGQQQPIQNEIFPINDQLFNNGFGQQQLIPRSKVKIKNLLPKTKQNQQPNFIPRDFLQLPSTNLNGYNPILSKLLATNAFNNQQQILPSQKIFNGYGNQQQDFSFIPQPQQTWNTQQQSASFSSSFGGQDQQPVSSGFLIQTNQQNDQEPVTNAIFMSSQVPPQRFISQPSNNW